MWLTLQSIPEETVISPSILDFMEKVLEPIPLPEPAKNEMASPISTGEFEAKRTSWFFLLIG